MIGVLAGSGAVSGESLSLGKLVRLNLNLGSTVCSIRRRDHLCPRLVLQDGSGHVRRLALVALDATARLWTVRLDIPTLVSWFPEQTLSRLQLTHSSL